MLTTYNILIVLLKKVYLGEYNKELVFKRPPCNASVVNNTLALSSWDLSSCVCRPLCCSWSKIESSLLNLWFDWNTFVWLLFCSWGKNTQQGNETGSPSGRKRSQKGKRWTLEIEYQNLHLNFLGVHIVKVYKPPPSLRKSTPSPFRSETPPFPFRAQSTQPPPH